MVDNNKKSKREQSSKVKVQKVAQQSRNILLQFKNSVGIKLFGIIFVSILLCVLVIGITAYSQAKNLIERNVSDASLQTIKQLSDNMDIAFKNFEDLSLQILMDKELSSAMDTLFRETDDYTKFQATRLLGDKLNDYTLSNGTISSAALIPLKGGPIATSGSSSLANASKILELPWFKEAVERQGRSYWVEPQSTGILNADNGQSIALARVIKGVSGTGANPHMLILEIPIERITERYSDVNLGENSIISVVNSTGQYVAHEDKTVLGQEASVESDLFAEEELVRSETLKNRDGQSVLTIFKSFDTIPHWKLFATIPVSVLVEDAKVIATATWITAIFAAILAVLIGYVVIRTIARPLVQLCELMLKGSKGDLTVRATDTKRQDEIGQLGNSFNVMMTQISSLAIQTTRSAADVLHTASELSDSSRKTAIAAQEIAAATEQIANGATSLATEAEQGSDMTSTMNEQMQSVLDANRVMVQSAVQVEQASEQGTSYMGMVMEKTGKTEEMTRSMVEKVKALQESTGSIVKILDVLTSIMQQTNILSLNAAIEATRAGAAGRGFMVVADEIRQLADQSRQSIGVVAQITETIQQEIDETVNVLSDAYPLFQEQISSVKEANQIFLSVQGQMGQFVERLETATGSIGELDKAQRVLSDAMTNVSAVAQQSSATAEEVASLSHEQLGISENLVQLSTKLDAVSHGLKDVLQQFKIE
ncbi:methyl-accepting chemotaxis protein [Paenibacillus yanchengensis]|uniref:Methyl-accepting chemotaxis protein n=1 Tax=Paenibacillus yanchengensis TaxID=2035833 RepID=A0ABW4YL17_9BACL